MNEEPVEESIVVDFDSFYADGQTDLGLKPGWYFWFIDQNNRIVSEPIGPYETANEAFGVGKIAVRVYYDE